MVVALLLSFVVTAMRETEIKAATTNAMARTGTMRARFDISEEERSYSISELLEQLSVDEFECFTRKNAVFIF